MLYIIIVILRTNSHWIVVCSNGDRTFIIGEIKTKEKKIFFKTTQQDS